MEEVKNFIIPSKLSGQRIDKALALLDTNFSRGYFQELIKENFVLVNSKAVNASYKVTSGDEIEVKYKEKESNTDLKPYEFNLDIVYEDNDLLVINKPQGLVVHPADGHHNDTLVNALIYAGKELSTCNGLERVGIVHRIDKDTSGLILVCKNDFIHKEIAKQLETHSMRRSYYALVDGVIGVDSGKISGSIARSKDNRLKMCIDPFNGKEAVTHFEVIKRFRNHTFIRCDLETGRTHQIRVHMSSIKHPVTGDKLYGGSTNLYDNGQLLHAFQLTFYHPRKKEEMTLNCPLPEYFKNVLDNLD